MGELPSNAWHPKGSSCLRLHQAAFTSEKVVLGTSPEAGSDGGDILTQRVPRLCVDYLGGNRTVAYRIQLHLPRVRTGKS